MDGVDTNRNPAVVERELKLRAKLSLQTQLFALVAKALKNEPVQPGTVTDWDAEVRRFDQQDLDLSGWACMSMEGIFSWWYHEIYLPRHSGKFVNDPHALLEQMIVDLKDVFLDEKHRFVSTDVWKMLKSSNSAADFLTRVAALYRSSTNDVQAITDGAHDAAFNAWTADKTVRQGEDDLAA